MAAPSRNPVVHLELHTGDPTAACGLYARLLGWRDEDVATAAGDYHALDVGGRLGGGVVECATRRPLWLPYVEVADIAAVTGHARALGVGIALEPREGPAGWRSVLATPAGAELALWQPKV